eukprot:TRINITY_DN120905_c0_g1_i1.p1 TRINITY_DN120905_c0_g1~~TRINITY_DN120905_c0_g1_i1.p1  ORF type:complete len:776 (+),score=195.05 TRINITY_DN120905_c0_g1_i1:216-2543(+)
MAVNTLLACCSSPKADEHNVKDESGPEVKGEEDPKKRSVAFGAPPDENVDAAGGGAKPSQKRGLNKQKTLSEIIHMERQDSEEPQHPPTQSREAKVSVLVEESKGGEGGDLSPMKSTRSLNKKKTLVEQLAATVFGLGTEEEEKPAAEPVAEEPVKPEPPPVVEVEEKPPRDPNDPDEHELDKGVYISREYDYHDPVTRITKVKKVDQAQVHMRASMVLRKGRSPSGGQGESTPSKGQGSDEEVVSQRLSSSGSRNSRRNSRGAEGGEDEKTEKQVLAARRIDRKKTISDMEKVTSWAVLVAKVLHTRVLNFKDVTSAAMGKKRVETSAKVGTLLSSLQNRAKLVCDQAMDVAKAVSRERVDSFDCEWEMGGMLPQLFSTEYLDTLILLAKGMRKLLAAQPMLARVHSPTRVFGDTHGQLRDVLLLFNAFGCPGKDDQVSYVFNGDFVDRGEHQLEVLFVLFAFKLAYPEKVWILRGNHEDRHMNQLYGFEDECLSRLGNNFGKKVFEIIQTTFEHLPIAAKIDGKILVVHGGIGRGKWTLGDISGVRRPLNAEELAKPESQWIFDILWSDPIEDDLSDDVFGVHSSPRGKLATQFAWDVSKTFCARNGLSLIIRSHQSKEDSLGFEVMHENLVMRVFSARDYEGHGNDGAVLYISRKEDNPGMLNVRPQVIRSTTKARKEEAAKEAELRKRNSVKSRAKSAAARGGGSKGGSKAKAAPRNSDSDSRRRSDASEGSTSAASAAAAIAAASSTEDEGSRASSKGSARSGAGSTASS